MSRARESVELAWRVYPVRIGRFVRALYLGNFAEDVDIADPKRVRDWLEAAGCARPDSFLERAGTNEVKERLRARTDDAVARGELFRGNDRLEDALAWLR